MRALGVTAALLVLALAACGGKTTAGGGGAGGGGTGTGSGDGAGERVGSGGGGESTPTVDVAKLGDPCEEDGACPTGMACKAYFGFAGPSGPEFKSCELECGGARGGCPSGSTCVQIADGPGSVCRVPGE
jgi:hypothetical protein